MGGRDKLLEDIAGQPLIRNRAEMCLRSKADTVRVVLSPDHPARRDALAGLPVEIVETDGAHLGLSHSLQTGVKGLTSNLMIVLADLPDLTTTDLDAILDAAATHPNAQVVRGTSQEGKPGHPVLLTSPATGLIAELSGDKGVQVGLKALADHTHFVQLAENRALTDLDTPADWSRWRASNPNS